MKRYYLCGPTVYNYPHIGNLRPTITFDLMIRAQRYLGEEVFYLHNITDIDDKIIVKAKAEGKSEKEISSFYENYYFDLFKKFNIEMPTKVVRVTDSLQDMYEYIQALINKNAAYQVGGNVFFNIDKFKYHYGSVSHQKLENLLADEDGILGKHHPYDFTLWKDTTDGIKFESPFGLGRPGWHTECSCFINKYFEGKQLDVHGGGIDLIFPHHENENIQHYALHNEDIAKSWMHFGTLNYKNQKMSKSIGNIIYPHDFLEKYNADTYKLLMLTTSYTKPINLTDELFEVNFAQVNKFKQIYNKVKLENIDSSVNESKVKEVIQAVADLEFAKAHAEIIKLTKKAEDFNTFLKIMEILGFTFMKREISQEDKDLYKLWKQEVANKNYEKADSLRDELKKRELI
ncbi:cysteine--tRNA ligase [Metamycoplasma neophronis]|uniref:Cysteine--tRNA ligase n=1 Tax=Metamycoplasma neophronis TaxID=872983 RepID=A0ABY2Z0I4_9BACT|nr:cysteine--tRNA ligase [Metamycoplasma neophronis]TPR54663.1 cysteine--tRNA ligase [Metamycoplasma neophronis]